MGKVTSERRVALGVAAAFAAAGIAWVLVTDTVLYALTPTAPSSPASRRQRDGCSCCSPLSSSI